MSALKIVPRHHESLDEALAEVRRLRRWKHEAIVVILRWEDAFRRSGITGGLGRAKADLMLDELERLDAENRTLRQLLDAAVPSYSTVPEITDPVERFRVVMDLGVHHPVDNQRGPDR